MSSFGIAHYVLIGLLAWGLPGILVGGVSAFIISACIALPVWLLRRRPPSFVHSSTVRQGGAITVLLLTLMYLLFDMLIGRQKFANNMFLVVTATANVIDTANETVSQGRGLTDLLGAMMVVLPFTLIDTARKTSKSLRVAMWCISLLYIFYDVGISRGYLLMAVLSVAMGTATKVRNLMWAGCLALTAFIVASLARGDFEEVTFSNPLFDGIAWPYINLGLLLQSDCGGASWIDFIAEFTKKFVPAFLIPKEIFSFNIEMTRCIYPSFSNAVESISIFTWLGEMYYYGPNLLTAIVAGVFLAFLCRQIDQCLQGMQLPILRVFSGLMCIVLLRSRVQDVFSFLLFLWIFLIAYRFIIRRRKLNSKNTSACYPDAQRCL